MILSEFIKKYDGKRLTDPWGQYPNECVSLVKRYAQEVQGVNPGDLYVKNKAKNAWLLYDELGWKKYYDKTNTPQKGDIVVYNGNYGDIAVVLSSSQVFGQYGTPVFTPAKTRGINQPSKPLGYLRLKGDDMDTNDGVALYRVGLFREPESREAAGQWNGKRPKDAMAKLQTSSEWKAYKNKVKNYDSTKKALDNANKNIATLQAQVKKLGEQPKAQKVEVDLSTDTKGFLSSLLSIFKR